MNKQATQHNQIGGRWFVLGAALLWGTTGTAQAFAPEGFDPKAIGALRLLIGGIALALLTIKRKEFGKLSDWQLVPVFLAGIFTASYQVCFFDNNLHPLKTQHLWLASHAVMVYLPQLNLTIKLFIQFFIIVRQEFIESSRFKSKNINNSTGYV